MHNNIQKEYLFSIKDKKEIAEDTIEVTFDTEDSEFIFAAGQHANFTFSGHEDEGVGDNSRIFSIASSPVNRKRFKIATRISNSKYKKELSNIPLNSIMRVSQSQGYFTLPEDSTKTICFLTGGIGATPVRSMVEWATEKNLAHKIFFFYSNNSIMRSCYLKDFITFSNQNSNFKFIPTITDNNLPLDWQYERGMINKEMIQRYLQDKAGLKYDTIYYISGPTEMVMAMLELLDSLGVDEMNIKTELFTGY